MTLIKSCFDLENILFIKVMLILNRFTNTLHEFINIFVLLLISNTVNVTRYNPYKQKFIGHLKNKKMFGDQKV